MSKTLQSQGETSPQQGTQKRGFLGDQGMLLLSGHPFLAKGGDRAQPTAQMHTPSCEIPAALVQPWNLPSGPRKNPSRTTPEGKAASLCSLSWFFPSLSADKPLLKAELKLGSELILRAMEAPSLWDGAATRWNRAEQMGCS